MQSKRDFLNVQQYLGMCAAKRAFPRPALAGIVNVTPDSFSDGGAYFSPEKAVEHALLLLEEGADFLDLGGESTRPGAGEVDVEEECRRLLPVVRGILEARPETVLSIDTRHAKTAEACCEAGARLINDVSGLMFDPEMARTIAHGHAGAIVMHSKAVPETMQSRAQLEYDDLCGEIKAFLHRQSELLCASGVPSSAIMLDVGVGFAKSRRQNYELIARAAEFERDLGMPFFWGVSRKSLLKRAEQDDLAHRIAGSLGLAVKLAEAGVAVLRVHDVAATRSALEAAAEVAAAMTKVITGETGAGSN